MENMSWQMLQATLFFGGRYDRIFWRKAKTRAPREIFPHDSHENAIPWAKCGFFVETHLKKTKHGGVYVNLLEGIMLHISYDFQFDFHLYTMIFWFQTCREQICGWNSRDITRYHGKSQETLTIPSSHHPRQVILPNDKPLGDVHILRGLSFGLPLWWNIRAPFFYGL